MVDSAEDIFFGSSMPLRLTDWSDFSLFLNRQFQSIPESYRS